jgi:aryl-alcohol dehydrogenase-like predicted oxidoreductase
MAIDKTNLARTGLEISRIGLGLANTHTMSHASDRERLILRALDMGITHFDTARFYSDGLSEVTLGKVLRQNRHSITIATKFGLIPTPLIGSLGIAAPLFRKARSALSKLGLIQYPKRSYTRATLQQSLHASLRALKTDYIDIYFLHEPLLDSKINDDVFEELEREKRKGSIRFIGVSGGEIDSVVARFRSTLDVVQSAESSWSEARFVPDITHSLFSDAMRGKDKKLKDNSIRHLLEQALARRRNGAVIVQTRYLAHLEQIVAWAAGR